ncbi:MAG: hypothetical protein J6U53_01050 [Tidjanibacter sp.]|nr:hypothetical protein [Tidjanibacter sp.]
MVRLYIDNEVADLDPNSSLSISLSIASLTSTSWGRASYSKSITIPATPHNRRLMGDCEQPLASQMFNHKEHTARVEVRGSVIIEGTIYLTASRLGREGYYRFNIIGNARQWVKGAEGAISSLVDDWGGEYSEEMIAESLAEEGTPLVRFLPVRREGGEGLKNYAGRILPENYHPFLHIGTLVERIFAKAGYAVESEFFASDFFQSLYMSGRWREMDWSGWAESMDFRAEKREDSEEANGNIFGMVYADPLANYSTVGNLVDLPAGEEGTFNGGAFTQEYSGRVKFTPTREMMVAFEYFLRWRTEYRIQSRDKLKGFFKIRPYYGDEFSASMANTFKDRREEGLRPNFQYTFIIFEPIEGATYKLMATERDENGIVSGRELLSTTSRSTKFYHTEADTIYELYVEMHHNGFISIPASDWAVYDGNVNEYGKKEVSISFRSEPRVYSPSVSKYFDLFYFGGAEENMKMQLLAGTSVRPVLYPHPMLEQEIGWKDVADYSFSGLDLLGALRELFDLQIYTDPLERKVCIEPRREFCDPEVVIDLSERMDASQPILVEELGADHPKRLTLRYHLGDKASEESSAAEGVPYGEWSAEVDNIFASEGVNLISNRLFAPSCSTLGAVRDAPSASLIVASDSDESSPRCVARCNFLPKIVSYRGMRTLPEGEVWNYPTEKATEYPLVTFFDDGSVGGEKMSLLFEDREAVEGLHRWWDGRVEALNHSRRITLYISLHPEEIEQFVVPNSTKHDFRAHYLLTIAGEKVLCRMEEIVDYNPAAPSTKVVFVTV